MVQRHALAARRSACDARAGAGTGRSRFAHLVALRPAPIRYARIQPVARLQPDRRQGGQHINETIGRIANLVVNENGAVEAAVISVGGFSASGTRMSPSPSSR